MEKTKGPEGSRNLTKDETDMLEDICRRCMESPTGSSDFNQIFHPHGTLSNFTESQVREADRIFKRMWEEHWKKFPKPK